VGQLLLDQFKGALHAGKGRFGIIIGAIAIGTSAAILLLVGDVYGFNAWFPAAMSVFVADHLHQAAPILDAVIALLIVSLSVVGVLRNLPRLGDEPSAEEFGKSMVYAVVGVLVSGALIAIGGETEQ
jgi:uncharacterized membrane protein